MKWISITLLFCLIVLGSLRMWRFTDDRTLRIAWQQLQTSQAASVPNRFDPIQLGTFPEPIQRYFLAVVEPGTPLRSIASIRMRGRMSLGTKESPNFMPIDACQLLAAPDGFVWNVRAGEGLTQFVGSDAAYPLGSWSRFWMWGLLPVARAGGNDDHLRSSFGRYIAEAVFWTPTALFPSDTVQWEAIDSDNLRVTVSHQDLTQAVDIQLSSQGLPVKVLLQRWSNANPAGVYQWQPFGGELSKFKRFSGVTVPTQISAGNFFGEDEYFPFYQVTVLSVQFLGPGLSESPQCAP